METPKQRIDLRTAVLDKENRPGRDKPLHDVMSDVEASNIMFEQYLATREHKRFEKAEREDALRQTYQLLLKWLLIITVVTLMTAAVAFAVVMVH